MAVIYFGYEKVGYLYTKIWKQQDHSYTFRAEKRGLFGPHIRTTPYIGSLSTTPPPPPPPASA